jgi:hypothetical protein
MEVRGQLNDPAALLSVHIREETGQSWNWSGHNEENKIFSFPPVRNGIPVIQPVAYHYTDSYPGKFSYIGLSIL